MSAVSRDELDHLLKATMESTKTFVEVMFNSVQGRVNQLVAENVELKRSLEFTQAELRDLQETVHVQAGSVRSLQTKQEVVSTMENRVRNMEDLSRAANLRVTGVEEQQGETAEQAMLKVQRIITDNLLLPNVKVLQAHRVRQQDETSRSRTIIAKLPTASDKIKCLRESSKLKGKNIFVNDDVSSATMAIRRTKFDELKRKRSEGYVAYFSGANLITKRRQGYERSTVVNNGSGTPIHTTPPRRTSTSDTVASSAAVIPAGNVSPLMSTASGGEQQTTSTVDAAVPSVTPSLDEESFASDASASTDASGGARAKQGKQTYNLRKTK